jgi:hypothetical protein
VKKHCDSVQPELNRLPCVEGDIEAGDVESVEEPRRLPLLLLLFPVIPKQKEDAL